MSKKEKKEKVIYQGFFVDPESENELEKIEGDRKLQQDVPDKHITFRFMPKEKDLLPPQILGQEYKLRIMGYGNDGKNSGFSVELPEGLREFYKGAEQVHITTSLAEGAKAVDTGKLEFKKLETPIAITGKMGYFIDGKVKNNPLSLIKREDVLEQTKDLADKSKGNSPKNTLNKLGNKSYDRS